MIRLPMLNSRDLGPMLAIAAAVVAVIAIIAGFVVIGGPGHTRDRRLDEITQGKLNTVLDVVQCAFNATNLAPLTFEAAKATRPNHLEPNAGPPTCGATPDNRFTVVEGESPAVGEVTYEVTSVSRIKLCANYRVEGGGPNQAYASSYGAFYPQIDRARPGGVECYEIDLVRTVFDPVPHK